MDMDLHVHAGHIHATRAHIGRTRRRSSAVHRWHRRVARAEDEPAVPGHEPLRNQGTAYERCEEKHRKPRSTSPALRNPVHRLSIIAE